MKVPGEAVYTGSPVVEVVESRGGDPCKVAVRMAASYAELESGEAREAAKAIRGSEEMPGRGFRVTVCDDGPVLAVQLAEFHPESPEALAEDLEWAANRADARQLCSRCRAVGVMAVATMAEAYYALDGKVHVAYCGANVALDPGEAGALAVVLASPRLAKEYVTERAWIQVDSDSMSLASPGALFCPEDPDRLAEALEKAARKALRNAIGEGGCQA